MNVAICGGGGFIGSAIVDRLLEDGHCLRILERPRVRPHRRFGPGEDVEWLAGDLLNVADAGRAIDGIDVVVHLVSTTIPASSSGDPIFDIDSNLVASVQLLNLMVAADVRRMIFISSGGTVYGTPVYLPIDESHPTEPRVPYGITKLAIEKYVRMFGYLHGIRPTILRVANPYGARQLPGTGQGVVSHFLSRAIHEQPFEVWGDGSVVRDYVYVSDVADAFARALNYEGEHTVFNVCSGVGISLNDLMGVIERTLGCDVRREYRPGRDFDVPVSILDNSLARRELGWEPRVPLEEGIARTAAWQRATLP
ncbi:MAG TPA: NAD-dependent epimerase/dehydratase family protein [Thermoleophilia bacterium]|nr:NAD-dependent epimerase/dehydratase family protein [Thermoleophilia bacterium]